MALTVYLVGPLQQAIEWPGSIIQNLCVWIYMVVDNGSFTLSLSIRFAVLENLPDAFANTWLSILRSWAY